ncbi:MAG TPA: AzlC family ABC transporter permease [Gaiellales bacterium]
MWPIDRTLARTAGSVAIAASLIGASFGVFARASGVDPWIACAMSIFVFAGGAQFLVVGLIAGGTAPFAAVLAGLVLNARHFPFGLSLAGVLRGSLLKRALASHVMIDESTALALAQPTPELGEKAFLTMGISLFVTWNIGTIVGVFAAGQIGDPAALGIDAAFPAGLLAMLAPQLRRREGRVAAAGGAAIALAATPLLPAGAPIMLAGIGALAGLACVPRPVT